MTQEEMSYQIPKGLYDILPYGEKELWRISDYWQFVETIMRKLARDYNMKEVRTPLFEQTSLFIRGVGETSDIVSKEMYTFLDKGERSLTLRPEGTASLMRAFIEKNLASLGPVHKFFYIGPMFRYERPQAGRYRQHHQFGVEAIGVKSFEEDVEVIDMLLELYRRLGLKHLLVKINSLGDEETRNQYRSSLKKYLSPHLSSLSEESKVRLEKNPLRILDSKDLQDQKLLEKAPKIIDFLTPEAKDHFDGVTHLLKALNVEFVIDPKLVRGMDYYNRTVFEIVSTSLGAQNAIGGGGRYDALLKSFGGPDLPGVGFGTGIERILQTMIEENVYLPPLSHPFLFLIGLGKEATNFLYPLTARLRHLGISSQMDFETTKLAKALQHASKSQAAFTLILGEEELKKREVVLKNMETREQYNVSLNQVEEQLMKLWDENRFTLKEKK